MLRFGTDGVRGLANAELTPEGVLALGRAAARVLVPVDGRPRTVYVGRDTRISGPLLQAALSAGLASEGIDVVDLGVVPTPAVAHLSAADDVPGAMISASHNPFPDNGIKLFAAGGRKLADPVEAQLEHEFEVIERLGGGSERVPVGGHVGTLRPAPPEALPRYVDHVAQSLDGRRLDGLAVVLDCGNGAASTLGPEALRRLGADVDVLFDRPDGRNINEGCGSTSTAPLAARVVATGAALGLAFDGDADRLLAVDHEGREVDGDHLLAILARDRSARGLLVDDTVVVTVMTNLGFHRAMGDAGIRVETTPVGDRHVLDALARGGWSLGGEQSGHVIMPEQATTGDGLLTAVQVLDAVRRTGQALADLAGAAMTRMPQVLRNVAVAGAAREALERAHSVWAEVGAVEADLGGHGRVLLRPSGTEPLVRVMVEADTAEQAEAAAARLVAAVQAELGADGRHADTA